MGQDEVFRQVVRWIESQPQIRAAILVGSHAENRRTDELSDYDISLFCTEVSGLVESESWLENIAPVWVSIPEQFTFQGTVIPTRLAIFEGGHKVDFAFYPLEILDILTSSNKLPDEYNMGYKVLVDKDQLTSGIPNPTFAGFKTQRPSEKEFNDLVKEFWFEVYHVAKYLRRQDLWSVQFRLSGIHHNYLIKMICWNEASKHDWNYTTSSIGKRMHEWVGDNTWKALHQVFPHFEAVDSWNGLSKLMDLFVRLAREVASDLDYSYPTDMEKKIASYVETLAMRSS